MEKALVCSDIRDDCCSLLPILTGLYHQLNVENANDSLALMLHILMLECDFVPIGGRYEVRYEFLPKSWKDGGIYKVQYFHVSCPDEVIQMTCVPLNDFIAVHGTWLGKDSCDGVSTMFRVRDHVRKSGSYVKPNGIYCCLPELSCVFKDKFVYAVIAEIQHACGILPTVGFAGLPPDLKFYIMSGLPVDNLVAMSAVNQEFHEIAESDFIWKQLFARDFSSETVSSENRNHKWKELYIKEYKEQKVKDAAKKTRSNDSINWLPLPSYQPFWNPCPRPFFEDDDDFDFPIGLAPEISQAFPHLRRRYQSNNTFLRILYGDIYM